MNNLCDDNVCITIIGFAERTNAQTTSDPASKIRICDLIATEDMFRETS